MYTQSFDINVKLIFYKSSVKKICSLQKKTSILCAVFVANNSGLTFGSRLLFDYVFLNMFCYLLLQLVYTITRTKVLSNKYIQKNASNI